MFWIPLALAGSVPEVPNGDVVVTELLHASLEVLAPALSDTRSLERLMPERCGYDWHHSQDPLGPADMMYNIKSFQRRLVVQITVRKPLRRIEMDHLGPKGFITEYRLDPEGDATRVTIHTYLNPPGWPMQRYYFKTVKPKWERCHRQMLQRLRERVE